jgi:hypothetical protein
MTRVEARLGLAALIVSLGKSNGDASSQIRGAVDR